MKYFSILSLTVLFAITCSVGCKQADQSTVNGSDDTDGKVAGQAFVDDGNSVKNILQIAMGSPDHSTLVAGVQAASLENVLANNGPLTVFAPTNAAFDALPEGVLANLLKPENKSALANIITFHASPGTYKDNLLKDGMKLFQATGDYVEVKKEDGKISVQGANIIATVDASNGVVHVIDKVLLPPEK